MNIALIEISRPGDNKDYNNGFGTTFDISAGIRAGILKKVRKHYEFFPTISYAYISALFKKHGHTVKYYRNQIPETCDLAILNCTAIRYSSEQDIIQKIKSGKNYPLGVYGALPSAHPELYNNAAFVMRGEPETAIEKIASNAYIPSGFLPFEYTDDLDSLPFPDWGIFDLNRFSYAPLLPGKPFTFMQKSRGCLYNCSYCPHNPVNCYRNRKMDNVINEIIFLKSNYNIRAIHFRDSCFTLNDKELEAFLYFSRREKQPIHWGMETRIDLLDKEKIDCLYQCGLRAIKVGIENASLDTLEQHKRFFPDFEKAKALIKHCRKKGIRTNACYIIGFPQDSHNSVQKTIQLAKSIHSSYSNFFILTPLPGTEFENNNEIRIFDTEWEHRDNFHLVFKHKNFTPETLRKIQSHAICRYYFRLKWLSGNIVERLKNLIKK